jgi:UDP-N-acetylmuramate dehydrogenase
MMRRLPGDIVMASDVLQQLEGFADITRPREPLGPYTYLKIGGPAEALVQPRSADEVTAVVRRCREKNIPLRVLGGGGNILVRDEGVRGVVLRLAEPVFKQVTVDGKHIRAGSGATLSALISAAARHGLCGLETLVGMPGTVGGALKHNAGDRAGEIGQFVSLVEVVDSAGTRQVRERDELHFAYRSSNLDDPVILAAEFELDRDSADAIVKRMRKAWIQRKSAQPFSFQAAGRIFKNPRGLNAAALIEQAGLVGTRVGGAEVSDRDANYIVAEPGTPAGDVLRLIDLVRSRVQDRFRVDLELEISVW